MKIVEEAKNKLIVKVKNNNRDIEKAFDLAEKKFKVYKHYWNYSNNNLVFEKTKLQKCELCGKKDVLDFEFDNGDKIYKICAFCWVKLNG